MKKNTIYGIRPLIEAIRAGKEIDKVLIQKGLQGQLFEELRMVMREFTVPYQFVPVEKLNSISGQNHQGIIAFVSEITYQSIEQILPTIYEEGKTPLFIILDGITDVRNLGAVARTAECAGVQVVIIPDKRTAQINADAIKTSAGALHKIPVHRSANLLQTIDFLKKSGLQIVACTEKGNTFYSEADLTIPTALIMGSEDIGIAPELLKVADKKVKIPIYGEIESLNVSVAAGIIMYEAIRQRGTNK